MLAVIANSDKQHDDEILHYKMILVEKQLLQNDDVDDVIDTGIPHTDVIDDELDEQVDLDVHEDHDHLIYQVDDEEPHEQGVIIVVLMYQFDDYEFVESEVDESQQHHAIEDVDDEKVE